MRGSWLAPLTGVAFVVVGILAFAIGGEPPDAESPLPEIVDHYVDNNDSVIAGAFLEGLAALFLIFFGNHLRQAFSAAGEAAMSATVLVGAAVMAVGLAIDATLSVALAEAAGEVEDTSLLALQALWDNDFVPLALGTLVFLISAGLSVLRTGILPRWLGWVALVLVVIGVTPLGWIAFLAGAIWILVVSVMMALAARRADAAPPA